MVGLQLPGVYSTRQAMDCKRSIHNSLTPERGTFRRHPRHPRQGPSSGPCSWTLSALSHYSGTALDCCQTHKTFSPRNYRKHGRYGRYARRHARHASQCPHRRPQCRHRMVSRLLLYSHSVFLYRHGLLTRPGMISFASTRSSPKSLPRPPP